jgi:hypothetical protein
MGWLADMMKGAEAQPGFREKLDEAEKKIVALEAERDRLKDENLRLKADITRTAATKESFVEASGVLWKRKAGGGIEPVPYCPTCKSMLADYSGSLLCIKCNWQSPIKSFEVPRIHHDLFLHEKE